MPSANAQRSNELDMTAISVFYDAGVNPLRKTATLKAVQHWMMQSHLPDEFLFLELGFDGVFTFTQADFPEQIHYIRIDGTERNKYLFQKEHLWNIAAKMATHEKLMFIDSDMSPLDDQDWFFKAYKALDKCLFTQGFNTLTYLDQEDRPSNLFKYSFSAGMIKWRHAESPTCNPGGVYCINKFVLYMIGGFNFLPLGGGDSLWWNELFNIGKHPWYWLVKRSKVYGLTRNICAMTSKNLMYLVDVDIFHFYHGEAVDRSYMQRQYLLMTEWPWMNRIMQDGENGLLEWIDVNHRFVDVAKHLPSVKNDKNQAKKLVPWIDYQTFLNKVKTLQHEYDIKTIATKMRHIISICSNEED